LMVMKTLPPMPSERALFVSLLFCVLDTTSMPDYWANVYFKTNFNH
jgi:hypothetical protein